MHTTYTVGPHLRVSEDIAYANGTSFVTIHYGIQNISGDAVSLRAGALADLYVGNNDSGNGAISTARAALRGRPRRGRGSSTACRRSPPGAPSRRATSSPSSTTSPIRASTTRWTPARRTTASAPTSRSTSRRARRRPSTSSGCWPRPRRPGTVPARRSPPPRRRRPTSCQTGDPKLDALPPPVAGKTVNIGVRKGRIFIKIPPSKKFVELKDPRQIPVGATIDSTKGRVNLVSAADKKALDPARLVLRGHLHRRPGQGRQAGHDAQARRDAREVREKASAVGRQEEEVAQALGRGQGHASAPRASTARRPIRGTRWLVQDTCAGTLTKVAQGVGARARLQAQEERHRPGRQAVPGAPVSWVSALRRLPRRPHGR